MGSVFQMTVAVKRIEGNQSIPELLGGRTLRIQQLAAVSRRTKLKQGRKNKPKFGEKASLLKAANKTVQQGRNHGKLIRIVNLILTTCRDSIRKDEKR